jgi:uncharacterized protein
MVKMINRVILGPILNKLPQTNKIVIVYGARQVGKTTLANQIIAKLGLKILKINTDDLNIGEIGLNGLTSFSQLTIIRVLN